MVDFFAAGAFVEIGDKVLLFKRASEAGYDLPFGKRDPGETPEQTAIREVKEETGYDIEILPDKPFTRVGKRGLCVTLRGKAVGYSEPTHSHEGSAIVGEISLLQTGRYPHYNRKMIEHFKGKQND
jgi:8-oxo-dGTP pyrophosphatase MutT (NUDIX family)